MIPFSDNVAGIIAKAVEHVAAVHGGLCLFRDLVDDMNKLAEQGIVDVDHFGGIVGGWVERFDFVGNALGANNDELIEALQAARIPSILCSGSVVMRTVLSGKQAEEPAVDTLETEIPITLSKGLRQRFKTGDTP